MRVLIVGNGGREHALAWRLNSCDEVSFLASTPSNPAIAEFAECFDIKTEDIDGLVKLAQDQGFDLVVIGPEIPLALGLADELRKLNISCFGPSKAAAMLEASKAFSKDFMARHNIPTARYGTFSEIEAACEFLMGLSPPYVIKASGLAAGKGVVIAKNLQEALETIDEMFDGKFGDASSQIVIEEFMEGEEASFFVLCNSNTAISLPVCQDHKRAFDNDQGPNTGGMGAYAPTALVTDALHKQIMENIVSPTLKGLKAEGTPYNGVLYVGLMIKDEVARVVEYNCRFGDPECQILMQFVADDFANCLKSIADEKPARLSFETSVNSAVTIVMAANGYPGEYEKNIPISGIKEAEANGAKIFHAGTKMTEARELVSNGGRVLNVTACGESLGLALEKAYGAIKNINAKGLFYRTDIGQKEMGRK